MQPMTVVGVGERMLLAEPRSEEFRCGKRLAIWGKGSLLQAGTLAF